MMQRVAGLAIGWMLVGCGARSEGTAPRNVLLVTLDTTRADHLGAYGMRSGVTPCLDQLAREGVVFEQAMTPVPITLPAHTSLLTGMYPPFHGVHDNGTFHLSSGCTTLAEILAAQGFATGAFVAARVLDKRHGLAQGFDVYRDASEGQDSGGGGELELPAGRVVDRAIEWLDSVEGQRFFAWVHFFDPHQPFQPPLTFQQRFPDDPYLGEIAYADSQLARLRTYLVEKGQFDETLIVVTSDHGEGLGEHGEQTHSVLAYQSTLHVPLIWRHPALAAGQRVSVPVSLVDVLPGVLGLLELPATPGHGIDPFDGGALERERELYFETEFAMRNFGWSALRGTRSGNSKFIAAPRSELFDLVQDSSELHNLLAEGDARLAGLGRRLERTIAELQVGRPGESTHLALSAEDARQLESLGYVAAPDEETASAFVDPKDRVEYAGRVMGLWMTLQSGQRDQARQDAELILAENPNVVLAWSTLAAITGQEAGEFLAMGDKARSAAKFEEALGQAERALLLDPRRIDCLMLKGAAERRLGRDTDAARTFERCIQVQPDYALPYRLRGRLLENAGQLDLAAQHYERFLELSPEAGQTQANTRERLGRIRGDG